MPPPATSEGYKNRHFPGAILSHRVWLYSSLVFVAYKIFMSLSETNTIGYWGGFTTT